MKAILSVKNLLEFIWENPNSDFYTRKYKSAGLEKNFVFDENNFEKLPFLTREELESTPPDQRLFVSSEDIKFIAYTSGTTSRNPLITYFGAVENYYFDPTLAMGVNKLLILLPALNKHFGHTFVQQCIQSPNHAIPLFGDYQNLANSAYVGGKTGIDAIYATPTIAGELAVFLEKYYDPTRVKLLALCSETLTDLKRRELEFLYPGAHIANLYASSEIGQFILYPCRSMILTKKDFFHILTPPVLRTELVSGELVLTYANNPALPLIRYRTGDFFEEIFDGCGCGVTGAVYRWAGRKDVDKIRVSGIEIKSADMERLFQPFGEIIGDKYQLHFYNHIDGGHAKVKLIFEILSSVVKNNGLRKGEISQKIIQHLLNHWRISSQAMLKDAVARGFFTEPEVVFVETFSVQTAKRRILIDHLNG